MSTLYRSGLVLLGVLSVLDLTAPLYTDGQHPPMIIAIMGSVLGLVSIVLVVLAWRGRAAAAVGLSVMNEYFLKVVGNRYVSRLNGVAMVDFTDPKPVSRDGAIALQLHSGGRGNMKFKDIYVRDLTRR